MGGAICSDSCRSDRGLLNRCSDRGGRKSLDAALLGRSCREGVAESREGRSAGCRISLLSFCLDGAACESVRAGSPNRRQPASGLAVLLDGASLGDCAAVPFSPGDAPKRRQPPFSRALLLRLAGALGWTDEPGIAGAACLPAVDSVRAPPAGSPKRRQPRTASPLTSPR